MILLFVFDKVKNWLIGVEKLCIKKKFFQVFQVIFLDLYNFNMSNWQKDLSKIKLN